MKLVFKISGIMTWILSCIACITQLIFSKSITIKVSLSWVPFARQISHIFKSISNEGRNLPVTTHEMVACTKFNAL
jgi:hypothetical protein